MGSVRLYAIAIDEVRDIFRATEESRATLRAIAAQRFAIAGPLSPGLLGKLGPVFRRAPDAPVIRPETPSGSDVDVLLSGRYVPPHRLGACWTLLEAWLDALAWDSIGTDCTEAQFDDFDFALVRAEVPARYGLRSLIKPDLDVSLLPAPGLAAGWVPLAHARAMADAWREGVPRMAVSDREVAEAILAWLERFPGWADEADAQGRRQPDLVSILHA